MKKSIYACALVAAAVSFFSCKGDQEPAFVEEVTVSPATLTFAAEGETKTFTVTFQVPNGVTVDKLELSQHGTSFTRNDSLL